MENYIIANKTDVGRTRQVNEDSMITFDSPNGRVVAVCDGMGGQAAGDVASQLACNIIRDILENNTFADPLEAITRSMLAANQGILHRTAQEPELEGMGATCVMLIIKDGVVYYGWVGDSRIYYISNHTIRQISRDQSYVQSLVDSGQITQAEAAHHPQKNEITNALGLQGMTPPMLCQMPITPEPGSVFLLCSDGLSGMVDNAQIERVVSKSELSLHEKAEHLVALANQNGGLDNITVQLVEFQRDGKGGMLASGGNNRRKKGGLWMWIAAALLVVALAIGAYFLFFNGKKEKEQKAEDTTTIEKSTDSRTTTGNGATMGTTNGGNGSTSTTTTTTTTQQDRSNDNNRRGKTNESSGKSLKNVQKKEANGKGGENGTQGLEQQIEDHSSNTEKSKELFEKSQEDKKKGETGTGNNQYNEEKYETVGG